MSNPWTIACQAPLSKGFSREEYWSGFPCPPPGDLPDSGIEPASLIPPEVADEFFTTSATWEALVGFNMAEEIDVSNTAEKAMASHSSTLAWKIPWTEEPGRLQSMGSLPVRYD